MPHKEPEAARAWRDEKKVAFAEEQLKRLSLKPGDMLYAPARSAALRGWPAFRIAQAYNMPIED